MDIVESTASFEAWLGGEIPIVAADLERKHDLMTESPFVFFRATYYRWLQQVLTLVPDLEGPRIACVGDLHVENFGTWRNDEAELVWGVNDLDESEELPYTFDLARLATSAVLAISDDDLDLDPEEAHAAILDGYRRGLRTGGEPFVLSHGHDRLRRLVDDALDRETDDEWWTDLIDERESTDDLPSAARAALLASVPDGDWRYEVRPRVAGAGSLGRRRFVATGDLHQERAARELKEVSPPSGRWLPGPPSRSAVDAPMVRSPDPTRALRGGWVARRIAPDTVKLKLKRLSEGDADRRLLGWMGQETANVHLGTPESVDAIQADLEARGGSWLSHASATLAAAVRRDWADWTVRDLDSS